MIKFLQYLLFVVYTLILGAGLFIMFYREDYILIEVWFAGKVARHIWKTWRDIRSEYNQKPTNEQWIP